MNRLLWVSTKAFCCGVVYDEDSIIIKTAPILKKFIGQPVSNLRNWLIKRKLYIDMQSMPDPKEETPLHKLYRKVRNRQ